MVGGMVPQRLRWLEVAITFGQDNYPDHVPSSGCFPLIVSLVVGCTCLSKVLMDGGSGINILYADILDRIKIPRSTFTQERNPSTGSSQGCRPCPSRASSSPSCLGFHKELLNFEVLGSYSTYHVMLE